MNNNESKNKAVFIRSFSICPIGLSIDFKHKYPQYSCICKFYLRDFCVLPTIDV